MNREAYILISQLCTHYSVEQSFFYSLDDNGLIEIITIESLPYLHRDEIPGLEKIIRIAQDLDLDMAGIDVVLNLLHKIETLQTELRLVRNKLSRYE